jgi:hypothetical protein
LHQKDHWTAVAKASFLSDFNAPDVDSMELCIIWHLQTIVDHREWTLGLEGERQQAHEAWQKELEIIRRPLRDPYEVVIRRMTKQRRVDDKRREKLRELERVQALEAEQARVLVRRVLVVVFYSWTFEPSGLVCLFPFSMHERNTDND